MKRLIKYHNFNDQVQFSDCSTEIEVLPELVSDDASEKKLLELAKKYNVEVMSESLDTSKKYGWEEQRITHSFRTSEKNDFIGFITLPKTNVLKPIADCSGADLSKEQIKEVINEQKLDIDNLASVEGEIKYIIPSWKVFTNFQILGYTEFKKWNHGYVFEDEVAMCSCCGEYIYINDYYNETFKIVDHELIGISCGCYEEEEN